MSLSRRSFVRTLGIQGAVALSWPAISSRGLEASREGPPLRLVRGRAPPPIRLDSNENPYGPPAEAFRAIEAALSEANRYPDDNERALLEALAKEHGVKPENIVLGAGSTESLRLCVTAFTSRDRPLVTALPTFENPVRYARALGIPAFEVPVDATLGLDLDGMVYAAAAQSAGLVFFCNPNNPTGTVHGAAATRDFIARAHRLTPSTVVLVDEAYHEFVRDPSYASMIPLALENRRVVVARTFSKAYGMAGLRLGYALGHADTMALLRPFRLSNGANVLASAAGIAALGARVRLEEQRRLNRQAIDLTRGFFRRLGYTVGPSDANFLFFDVRQDVKAFREACLARGVAVGRPFPPFATYSRISMGTMEEMRKALPVFEEILSTRAQ
ncbi:MAG: pyridoxal phosphate-dependent aminotransferase [Gemmatimonadales bacterium]